MAGFSVSEKLLAWHDDWLVLDNWVEIFQALRMCLVCSQPFLGLSCNVPAVINSITLQAYRNG